MSQVGGQGHPSPGDAFRGMTGTMSKRSLRKIRHRDDYRAMVESVGKKVARVSFPAIRKAKSAAKRELEKPVDPDKQTGEVVGVTVVIKRKGGHRKDCALHRRSRKQLADARRSREQKRCLIELARSGT
jgi:hypothetical protein